MKKDSPQSGGFYINHTYVIQTKSITSTTNNNKQTIKSNNHTHIDGLAQRACHSLVGLNQEVVDVGWRRGIRDDVQEGHDDKWNNLSGCAYLGQDGCAWRRGCSSRGSCIR